MKGRGFSTLYPEGMVRQGISAELIAARWRIAREEMDFFALESHQRARGGGCRSYALDCIARYPFGRRRDAQVERDEGLRRDTSLDRLAALKPAFEDEAAAGRFPDLNWSVTAGNSSQVTDGAAAMLIAEEVLARRLG